MNDVMLQRPQVVNAGTTYGVDTSESNNYGLGSTFASTVTKTKRLAVQGAAPSWWWLVLVLIGGFFFL